MRYLTLLTALVLTACSSGTYIIVRDPSPPPPPPPRIEPLEITLARPIRGQLLVQTNRPAYIALFEIVPERGVALLAPAYAHQRTWMLAGLNWVPISWKIQSAIYYGPPSSTRNVQARWVYAIASDQPLRIPDAAFDQGYMRRVLGPSLYTASNPYATMRAISRAFVPAIVEERWAEDAYALAATYASDPYRVVRIYCANRTVYEVPDELADRAWCPVASGGSATVATQTYPTRPDSIVNGTGSRIRRRVPTATTTAPVDRVREPQRGEQGQVSNRNGGGADSTRREAPPPARVGHERRVHDTATSAPRDSVSRSRHAETVKPNDPRRPPRQDADTSTTSAPAVTVGAGASVEARPSTPDSATKQRRQKKEQRKRERDDEDGDDDDEDSDDQDDDDKAGEGKRDDAVKPKREKPKPRTRDVKVVRDSTPVRATTP